MRERLLGALQRDALPASLLLTGARGIGKQRLALWLAQAALCERRAEAPCGACRSCRFARELTHPDLHWFFPRPRLKDSDPSVGEVQADYADATADRVKARGLYAPPSGAEGIYVAAVRALVQLASVSPAIGRRKVFVVGDAERMVPQEGSDAAANAFLKLLEEPPADTVIVLTSSEPGALLPTIRSRVVCVRVAPLTDTEMRAFADDEVVAGAIGKVSADRLEAAGGAPGALVAGAEQDGPRHEARRLLETVTAGTRADRMRFAFSRGAAGARGAFSDMLDELTVALHDLAREASGRPGEPAPDPATALGASRAVAAVEQAKVRAEGNVSPQLVTAWLLGELTGALR
ncbi:DNA polymerase III delta' subunit [Gemmatirosa kalamazoonensis]|uniref:DNA polymerase III delta' subunit n=1 Tax=Gemmatirosa kalamazoonensis TaxID=861299 RepID=W0RJS7_9BACT|nr:DNA polymerase III delta' subunit [Gemmatirosa kalamazoonensis]